MFQIVVVCRRRTWGGEFSEPDVPSTIAAESSVAASGMRPPLVVDLDGTLARTDLLHETFAAAFFRNPLLTLIVVLRGLLKGRAGLKAALCGLAEVEVETLPLRSPLLAYLQEQKRLGREIHLATASDQSVASAVAAHVGLFDRVYASDGQRNLKGRAKAALLAAEFPGGFSYAGDCRADLAVWRVAASAVVTAPRRLADKARAVTELKHHFPDDGGGFGLGRGGAAAPVDQEPVAVRAAGAGRTQVHRGRLASIAALGF